MMDLLHGASVYKVLDRSRYSNDAHFFHLGASIGSNLPALVAEISTALIEIREGSACNAAQVDI